MSTIRFSHFRFDRDGLRLRGPDGDVPLRPTAARLLALLIEQDGRIVDKATMTERVWGRAAVSDQSLFQVISELRRALTPLNAIVTHPNRGYAWAVPIRTPRRRFLPPVAAMLGLGVALAGWWFVSAGANLPSTGSWPPSVHAFGQGMQAFERARLDEAERYFRLALRENPAFAEARLMVAEALLAQGRAVEARAQATAVLAASGERDAYASVAAMALIGRSESETGASDGGLSWTVAAAQRARERGFACAAARIEDRLGKLLAARGADAEAGQHAPLASAPSRVAALPVPAYCREIDVQPGGPGARRVEPAACGSANARRRNA